MWRHVVSNFLTLGIVLLVLIAGVVGWAKEQYVAPGPLTEAICLKVGKGAIFRDVVADLARKGAVSHPYILKVGADYAGKTGGLKAGSYLVRPGATMVGIVEEITGSGKSTCGAEINYRIGVTGTDIVVSELDPATNDFAELAKFDPVSDPAPAEYTKLRSDGDVRLVVTVAEGATSWQITDALSRADFLTGEIKDIPPEGALAPQQYEVARGMARSDLVSQMLADQAETVKTLWAARAEGLPYKTPEQAVVMASLVEKETGVAGERARVASVFLNRLAQGMKLQTDPTVIYGLTKGQRVLGRGLRQSELRSNTPYNTYVHEGLPPGPIANPGREAIEAALHPEASTFLFFVADGTGGHVFAETLAEHNKNVAKWRAIEAAKGGSGG